MSPIEPEEATAAFWAGRRVTITGATGFVGQHLTWQVQRLGAQIRALVRPESAVQRLRRAGIGIAVAPLSDVRALTQALAGCDVVFHLAAAVDFQSDWRRCYDVNVQGTRNLLAAARASGVRRIVHTSSIVAVGAARRPVVQDESATWDLRRLRVPYATTKRQAEELALSAAGPDLEVVVGNAACVVGPDDFTGSEFGTLCRRFWKGRIPFYFGGGNNFVDVRDVADGLRRAAELGRSGERYLLGGTNLSYHAFFAALARLAARPIFRLRLPAAVGRVAAWLNECRRRPGKRPYLTRDQMKLLELYFYFDSSKARRELGYQPRPLRQTLMDTYRFWRQAG